MCTLITGRDHLNKNDHYYYLHWRFNVKYAKPCKFVAFYIFPVKFLLIFFLIATKSILIPYLFSCDFIAPPPPRQPGSAHRIAGLCPRLPYQTGWPYFNATAPMWNVKPIWLAIAASDRRNVLCPRRVSVICWHHIYRSLGLFINIIRLNVCFCVNIAVDGNTILAGLYHVAVLMQSWGVGDKWTISVYCAILSAGWQILWVKYPLYIDRCFNLRYTRQEHAATG